jgi:hypothetical protein
MENGKRIHHPCVLLGSRGEVAKRPFRVASVQVGLSNASHAESVNKIAQEWYRRCEYQVLEVPMVSVDERCTFVLQALADRDA